MTSTAIMKVHLVLAIFVVCRMLVQGADLPKLILISMDGFRYNYLDRLPVNKTANFHYFMDRGVKAKWINNVYPTVTYPCHYTLITGMYSESHGMVNNHFYDPAMNLTFDFGNLLDNYYSKWYDVGAEPIYVTNHNAGNGRRTGSVLWPAGLADVKCFSPDRLLYPQDSWSEMNNTERIDTLMEWFVAEKDPINLGFLYFLEPDETAHHFGPESQQVNDVITGQLNDALGYLRKRLEEHGLLDSMNVILTSDHGMSAITETVYIDDFVEPSWYEPNAVSWTVGLFYPTKGNEAKFLAGIRKASDKIYAYEKGGKELRALHFTDSERVPPIVLEPREGVVMRLNRAEEVNKTRKYGTHGYDSAKVPNMRPFLIAWGPAFKEGIVAEPFDQVDIYPLMCHILGITPAPNNGSLKHVAYILKHPPEASVWVDTWKYLTYTPLIWIVLAAVGFATVVAGLFASCAIRNGLLKSRFRKRARKRLPGVTKYRDQADNSLLQGDSSDEDV